MRAFCFIILIISLAHASARPGFEPIIMDAFRMDSSNDEHTTDFICDTCLEASREAQEALADPKLFEKVSILSNEVCRTLPTDLGGNCLKLSEMYLHQTKTSLQELFHEENLCNSNGLCLERTTVTTNDEPPPEEDDECAECRKTAEDLFLHLNQPRMKSRIVEALVESCEEADAKAKQCKQKVHRYAPRVISNLEKLNTQDICTELGFCGA